MNMFDIFAALGIQMDKVSIIVCGQIKRAKEKFTTSLMQDTKKLA
jgi:hypothetical protein